MNVAHGDGNHLGPDGLDADDNRRARRAHPKNSKRWCRGVPGREHAPAIVIPPNASGGVCAPKDETATSYSWEIGCRHVEACTVCGKHLRAFLNKGECPDRPR